MLTNYERRNAKRLAADPDDLRHFEASVRSQNGEDGIIAEIVRRVGEGTRTFVEIGASDGAENCTAALVSQGWSGVWVEGDPEKVMDARRRSSDRPVRVVEAFVDRESIVSVLESASTPDEPDVLVIDVDGNDLQIWDAVSARYRPRIVVIEYNAAVGPHLQWAMPYNAGHRWNETAWHGASLAALARLGRQLGYVLAGCDSQGVNAFFVRRDDGAQFSLSSVRDQWVPPRFLLPYGHPVRPPTEFDVPPISVESGARISMRAVTRPPATVKPGAVSYFDVIVTNGADEPIGCSRGHPVQLAYWWLDETGVRLGDEPDRCCQPWRIAPGASWNLLCRVSTPKESGTYVLVLGLVQEGIRWLDECDVTVGTFAVGAG